MLQEYIKYKAEKNGITVRFVKLKDEVSSDKEAAKKLAEATEFLSEKAVEKEMEAQGGEQK